MGNQAVSGKSNGDSFDFNIASLSGAMAPSTQSSWSTTFSSGSIAQSQSERSVSSFNASVPMLAQSLALMQLADLESEAISNLLNGWSQSLKEENERAQKDKAHKSLAFNPHAESEITKQQVGDIALQGKVAASTSSPLTIDKGSDADMIKLASHMPASSALNELNIRKIWITGLSAVLEATALAAKPADVSPSIGKIDTTDSTAGSASALSLGPTGSYTHQNNVEATMLAFLIAGGGLAVVAAPTAAVGAVQAESQVILGAFNALSPGALAESATLLTGWFSAMWGVGQLYQLAAEKLDKYQNTKEGKTTQHDVEFAKNYAEKLAGSLNLPIFEAQIFNIIKNSASNSSEMIHQDPQILLIKAKLALLSVALGLILKLEEGVTREDSFKAVITGEIDLTKNDPYESASIKRMLKDEINKLILTLDPKEREAVLYQLLAYMAEDHAVEKMLDQQSLFYEVLRTPTPEEEALANFGHRPLDI